jgi:hypothetical protein
MSQRFIVALGFLALGCGAGSARDLSHGETEYLKAVKQRVADNRAAVEGLLADLGSMDRYYARIEREKTVTAFAQAKLLESMKAPWTTPPEHLQATQRAVVLYHLYELLDQERQRFEAQQAARDAERNLPLATYAQLGILLNEAIENEKVILEYLDSGDVGQIAATFDETLRQAHAFSLELAKSDDQRLQQIAADAEQAAARAQQARNAIQAVLTSFFESRK